MTHTDSLDAEIIRKELGTFAKKVGITVLETVDSTNTYAKSIADGTIRLVVSEHQSAGRGRVGRSFFSPRAKGIYMSLVLPVREGTNPTVCTIIAAVAAARVIERISDKVARIKWVNDIFCSGKKVCGILCEGITDTASGMLGEVVVGIGMNLYSQEDDFPGEIRSVAASVFPGGVTRNSITGMLAQEIISVYESGADIIDEYKDRLFILGKKVRYTRDGTEYEGTATDVNDEGNLVVTTEAGIRILSSGEISLGSDAFCE